MIEGCQQFGHALQIDASMNGDVEGVHLRRQLMMTLQYRLEGLLLGYLGEWRVTGQDFELSFPGEFLNVVDGGIGFSLNRVGFVNDPQAGEPDDVMKDAQLPFISGGIDAGIDMVKTGILIALDDVGPHRITRGDDNGRDTVLVVGQVLAGPGSHGQHQIDVFLCG